MTVVIATSGHGAELVLERLTLWSRSAYLEPFVWMGENGTVVLVDAGEPVVCGLDDALEGRAADAFVVGVALPADDGAIGQAQLVHVQAVQRRVEAVVPGIDVPPPTLLLFPLLDETRIEPPAEGTFRSTFVVVPEDQSDARGANHFDAADPDSVAAHVAHAIVSMTGLLRTDDAPFIAASADDTPDTHGAVAFVRCHSRVIDAGFLVDALAAKAFASRQAWPNPDPWRFQPDGFSEITVNLLVDRYFERHDEVLGLRELEPEPEVDPPTYSLLQALKKIWRFFLAELRARPWIWADQRLERFWDGSIVPFVNRLGVQSGVQLVRWRKQSEALSAAEFMAKTVPVVLPADDGATAAAWRDLVEVASAAVDGHDLPFPAAELNRGERRLIETRPNRIVPDPRERPPIDGHDVRSCDPAGIARLVADAAATDAIPSVDDPAADAGSRPSDVGAWIEKHDGALIWCVGERLARAIDTAERESATAPTDEDWQQLDVMIKENHELGRRAARRRRRWLVLRSVLALAGAGALVVSNLPTLLKPAGVFVVMLLWFLFLVRGWWRSHKRASERDKEIVDRSKALVRRGVIAALRRGDADRLKARYLEYLDWAEIIGHLEHRPWVAQATPYGRADELIAPPEPDSLPSACRIGYATFSELDLRRIAAIGESTAFRAGWLTGLIAEVLEKTAGDWLGLHPGSAARTKVIPDPYGDTAGLRKYVLESVRQGRGRSLEESGLAGDFAEKIGSQPPAALITSVVDSKRATNAPLPPAAEWFSRPEGVERLAAKVSELVVSITGQVNGGGSGWRGSGVLIGSTGLVATCRHCVEAEGDLQLMVSTAGGFSARADVVAMADDADLAVIRIPAETSLPAATLGTSSDLHQGEAIFALGFPFFGPETGGPTLSWGVVTAPRRVVEGKYSAREAYVQTNYPAGGGASGEPVFDLDGKLIGIHIGGFSDPGFEERSAHISFAAPAERLLDLLAGLDEVVVSPIASDIPLDDAEAGVGFAEFLLPLADSSPCNLGEHGVLSRHARKVKKPWKTSAVRAVADPASERQFTVDRAAGQALRFGNPLRINAVRIDASEVFFVGNRSRFGLRRLPWFVGTTGQKMHEPVEAAPSVITAPDDLGSL